MIRLSPTWQVRQFLLFRDLDEPDLWLGTDGNGRWGEVNGAHRPDLDGAPTSPSPAPRSPTRCRSGGCRSTVGDAAELSVLAIDVETLGVVPSPRSLRAPVATARMAHVTSGDARRLEFDVDRYGLATDVAGSVPTDRC